MCGFIKFCLKRSLKVCKVKRILIPSLLTAVTVFLVITLGPLIGNWIEANQISLPRSVHLLKQSLINARPLYQLVSNSTSLSSTERDHGEKRTLDSLNHLQGYIKSGQKVPSTKFNANGNVDSEEHSLTLPVPYATLSANELLQQQWVRDLEQTLLKLPQKSSPITLITCNNIFRDMLLNWLFAAKVRVSPPVANVVVLSIDQSLQQLLIKKEIPSVYINPDNFITNHLRLRRSAIIFVIRLTVVRLLNYMGYDTASFDADAIILKNPEALYQECHDSDVVASFGNFPIEIKVKWGVTICGGMFMIRSTRNSEDFWEAMSKLEPIKGHKFDDQVRMNFALLAMDPDWGHTGHLNIHDHKKVATTPSGLKVTILPKSIGCRSDCNTKLKSSYYIWHGPGAGKDKKMDNESTAGLWFLKDDWESLNSTATGEQWLTAISDFDV